jgi:hypothetical protein
VTKTEFAEVIAFIELAIGKPIDPDPKTALARTRVFFELLGDLPVEVLRTSVKRVLNEHKWASFPTPAEIREACALTQHGKQAELSAAEAWSLAWKAVGAHDPDLHGAYMYGGVTYESQWACITRNYPPRVIEAIHSFGVSALVSCKDPVGVLRGQFMKIYDQLAARDMRLALLSEPVKQEITKAGEKRIPVAVQNVIALIGKAP